MLQPESLHSPIVAVRHPSRNPADSFTFAFFFFFHSYYFFSLPHKNRKAQLTSKQSLDTTEEKDPRPFSNSTEYELRPPLFLVLI